MALTPSREGRLGPTRLAFALAIAAMLLLSACGGSGDGSSPTTGGQASTPASEAPPPPTQASGISTAASPSEGGGIADSACAALPPSAAESFDPRFTEHLHAGDEDSPAARSGCSYSDAPEAPEAMLVLELVPSPAEPSESSAQKICHALITQIQHDSTYKTSEAAPALGEESNLATGFDKAEMEFDEDETIYVVDWRQDGMCARLLYSSAGPIEPVSKFVALAESISRSG